MQESFLGNLFNISSCLTYSDMNNEKLKKLAAALENNTTVTNLDISYNRYLDDCAPLLEMLKKNTHITHLNLKGNGVMGDELALGFAAVLKVNNTLESIDLSSNFITDAGVLALAQALTSNSTHVTKLALFGNDLSSIAAIALAKMLLVNRTLQQLRVNNTKIGTLGVDFLTVALTRVKLDTSIREISCEGTNASVQSRERLQRVINDIIDLRHRKVPFLRDLLFTIDVLFKKIFSMELVKHIIVLNLETKFHWKHQNVLEQVVTHTIYYYQQIKTLPKENRGFKLTEHANNMVTFAFKPMVSSTLPFVTVEVGAGNKPKI